MQIAFFESEQLNEHNNTTFLHEMDEATFDAKNKFSSYRKAYTLRSEKSKLKTNDDKSSKNDKQFDIWKLKPLDFNWKLYCQPRPPKK
jgi:hypothetical protein